MIGMERRTIVWDREKVYREVWEKPATALAKEYGISDVALAKICRKLRIPKPGLGYWRRKECGFHGKPLPLPPMANPPKLVTEISVRPSSDQVAPEVEQASVDEQTPEKRIIVPPALATPHSLVAKTLRALQGGKPDERGLVRPRAKFCMDVCVTQGSVDRAVRVLDALVKALAERGYKLDVDPDKRPNTCVSLLGQTVGFGIEERIHRTIREMTATQKKEKEQSPWRYWSTQYDYHPTGVLQLHIRGDGTWDVRKVWSDGKKRRIENRLNDFIVGLVRVAANLRERRIRLERAERDRQEWERIRLEKITLIRKEEERVKSLESEAAAWDRSQRLRTYVEAVRHRMIEKRGTIEPGGELDLWLQWATAQADRLDPLVESPPSILDEKRKFGI